MKAWIYSILILGLAGCGNNEKAAVPPVSAEMPAQVVPAKPVKDHNYAMRDGVDYGYEKELSDNDRKQGKVTSELLMFRFAGKQNDKYQVYQSVNSLVSVFECQNPCEFIKTMIFSDGENIDTQRMRAVEGSIAWAVIQDAINGKMEQTIWISKDRKVQKDVWFSEKGGMQLILRKDPA